MSEIYRFGNGVLVRRADLLDLQIARYGQPGNPNLHEPIEEEWLLQTFLRDMPPNPVFVDVGAALGYYSILVKIKFPSAQVYSLEPLPKHASALRATFALNGLSDRDVVLLEAAIDVDDGEAMLKVSGFGSKISASSAEAIPVPSISMKTLLSQLPPVHLMKIDIQGLEDRVIQSAIPVLSQGTIPIRHVVVGTHGHAKHRVVAAALHDAGFTLIYDDPAPAFQPDGLIVASCKA